MAEKQSQEPKKMGRKPKFDYESEGFLNTISDYARKGYTDKEIAATIGISQEEFCRKKSEFPQISQCLKQARVHVCATIRGAFIKSALGGRVITRTEYVKKKCSHCQGKGVVVDEISGEVEECPNCGGTGWIRLTDKAIVSEQTLPPSVQAQMTLLLAYDEEWKNKLKGNDPTDLNKIEGIDIEVSYNKKEDLELQNRIVKNET